jgi:putative photosynthetic complex assembly protein
MTDPASTHTVTKTELIHRRGVRAAIALVVFTLAVTITVVLTDSGEHFAPQTEAVTTAELRFEDREDGIVAVFNTATGAQVMEYPAMEGVFVRSIMRTVARQRRIRGEEARTTPVTLTEHADGQLWLTDTLTGVQIYLNAFGPDNAADFAELLASGAPVLSANADPAAQGDSQ